MFYKIGWYDLLKAFFIPLDLLFISIFIGIFILALISSNIEGCIIVIMIILLLSFTEIGNGWKIDNGKLEIKAHSLSRVIEINAMEIVLVDKFSSWTTGLRLNGAYYPGLRVGRFNLKNGKNAIVFKHLENSKKLVIF